jgi:hypothetical protein
MKYQSNAQQVIGGLRARLEQMSGKKPSEYSVDKVVRAIALALYASNLRRIHNEGKDVNENQIGKYSTKTTFIGSSSFVNKGTASKVFTKNNKLEWRTIDKGSKQVHLALLPGGYKQIRQIENFETSHVNLQRSGRLMKDYCVNADGKDYVIGFASDYGKKISEGQEDHFAKRIWGISRNDTRIIDKILKDYTEQAMHA